MTGLRVAEDGRGTEPNNLTINRLESKNTHNIKWSGGGVALLSPSPVPVRPTDQLAGQPNGRERRGGQQNIATI